MDHCHIPITTGEGAKANPGGSRKGGPPSLGLLEIRKSSRGGLRPGGASRICPEAKSRREEVIGKQRPGLVGWLVGKTGNYSVP